MGFSHARGSVATVANVASVSVTLGAAPSVGDVVCVGIALDTSGTTITSVADNNSNSYTVTTNSPSTFQTGAGKVYLFRFIATGTPSATVKANISPSSGGGNVVMWVDDFTVSGGTAAFDKDAKANTGTASTTINTPSITPTGSGELLYSTAAAGGTISAPAAGGTLGSWTGAGGAITSGDMSEYDLSASTATAVDYTQSSGTWSAMAMAFTFTASGGSSIKERKTLSGIGGRVGTRQIEGFM